MQCIAPGLQPDALLGGMTCAAPLLLWYATGQPQPRKPSVCRAAYAAFSARGHSIALPSISRINNICTQKAQCLAPCNSRSWQPAGTLQEPAACQRCALPAFMHAPICMPSDPKLQHVQGACLCVCSGARLAQLLLRALPQCPPCVMHGA
jgi:hypothetical protein